MSARLVLSLALLGAVFACRNVDVCDAACKDAQAGGESAGGESAGGESAGGESAERTGSGAEAAGQPGTSGQGGDAGESGGAAGTTGLPDACTMPLAECDGSTLTPCETNTAWNMRHCGACGSVCDGLCQGSSCEPATTVWEGFADSMVVSGANGFALSDYGEDDVLLHVDIGAGTAKVLLDNVRYDVELALGPDRVYLRGGDVLRSARLDGSDLMIELESENIEAIGGTDKGAYYLDYEVSEDWEYTYRLWFRPPAAPRWSLIRQAAELEIVTSSQFGLLLREVDETFTSRLLRVEGAELTELQDAPPEWVAAAFTEDGPVLLLRDLEEELDELLWLTSSETKRYEILRVPDSYPSLVVHSTEVVIYFSNNGVAYMQRFGKNGASLIKSGLPRDAQVRAVDYKYVWYTAWADPITRRLLRAEWYTFDF